jgi:hypothetical protein
MHNTSVGRLRKSRAALNKAILHYAKDNLKMLLPGLKAGAGSSILSSRGAIPDSVPPPWKREFLTNKTKRVIILSGSDLIKTALMLLYSIVRCNCTLDVF